MSWYILQCKRGQEETVIRSCRQHLSKKALDTVFTFRCERLWRFDGYWKLVEKVMFPGYVFLESYHPEMLFKELYQNPKILQAMDKTDYLVSVYKDEEENLKNLCGSSHFLKMSYGYKENGVNYITEGPLIKMGAQIIQLNWHKHFAQVEMPVSRRKTIVWLGLGLDERMVG